MVEEKILKYCSTVKSDHSTLSPNSVNQFYYLHVIKGILFATTVVWVRYMVAVYGVYRVHKVKKYLNHNQYSGGD